MNILVRVILVIAMLGSTGILFASPINTFTVETENGTITLTRDIPPIFFGSYVPMTNSPTPGGLTLVDSQGNASRIWSVKKELTRNFKWGVVVKGEKIDVEQVDPQNPVYQPYHQMRLILQYEDGTLEAMRMYYARSRKYGARVVIGRYVKQDVKK